MAASVTLPVALPLASRFPPAAMFTLPAALNVTPKRELPGLFSVMSPLPVVVTWKNPSPAPMLRTPRAPAGCAMLVFTPVTARSEAVPLSTSGTPGAFATLNWASPALTTNRPIWLLAWLRSTPPGGLNPEAPSTVSVPALTMPAPSESCWIVVVALSLFASSDVVVAVVGAFRLIVVPVSVIVVALIAPLTLTVGAVRLTVPALSEPPELTLTWAPPDSETVASEVTAALTSTEGEVIGVVCALSDELLSVIAALRYTFPLVSDSVVAAPPAATVSGAVTDRLIDEASVTSVVLSSDATRAAVI